MSEAEPAQTSTTTSTKRDSFKGKQRKPSLSISPSHTKGSNQPEDAPEENIPVADISTNDGETCWICAESIQTYSVPPCGHVTCHICALRLRALFKKTNCSFCNQPCDSLVFTKDAEASFDSYLLDPNPSSHHDPPTNGKTRLTCVDTKLGIYFQHREVLEETLALLRFNCPDRHCNEILSGWQDLKRHAKHAHDRVLWFVLFPLLHPACLSYIHPKSELCIRNLKIFAQEHTLYTPNQLRIHTEKGDSSGSTGSTGSTGHPTCEFCRITHVSLTRFLFNAYNFQMQLL